MSKTIVLLHSLTIPMPAKLDDSGFSRCRRARSGDSYNEKSMENGWIPTCALPKVMVNRTTFFFVLGFQLSYAPRYYITSVFLGFIPAPIFLSPLTTFCTSQ